MSCCLICYRNCDNLTQIYNETEKAKVKSDLKRFFKLLERYFNRGKDKCCMSTSFPMEVDKLIEAGLVPCHNCHNQMDEFCDIYYILEETEMHLNWKIKCFGGVMERANNVVSSNGLLEFLKVLGDSEDEVEKVEKEIIEWRRILIEKCYGNLQLSFPRLMLKRCTLESSCEEMPAAHNEPDPPSPIELEISDSITDISVNLESNEEEENGEDATIAEDMPQATLPIKEDAEIFTTINKIANENLQEEINLLSANPVTSAEETEGIPARRLRSIHSCPKCSKTFSTLPSLEAHLTSHSSDKENSGNEIEDDAHEQDFDEYDPSDISSSSDSEDDLENFKEEPNVVSTPSTEDTQLAIEEGMDNMEKFPAKNPKLDIPNALPETNTAKSIPLSTEKIDIAAYIPIISRQLGFQTCPKCSKIFSTSQTLQAHLASHSNDVENISTSNVQRKKKKKTLKKTALFYNNAVEFIKIPCPIEGCAEVLHSLNDLEDHKKLHGKFSCEFCSNSFDYAPNLARHELAEHCDLKGKCPRKGCDSRESEGGEFINHVLKDHLGLRVIRRARKFNCKKCKTGFMSKRNLKRHLAICHIINNKNHQDKEIKCDVEGCSKSYSNKEALYQHKRLKHRTNAKAKPVCQICNGKFSTERIWNRHVREHHPETLTIRCIVEGCNAKFASESSMEYHLMKVHKNEMDRISKLCPHCGKKFYGTFQFQVHLEWHERVRGYVCEACGKTFKNNDHLAKHYLSHSGPGSWQYQCEICAKKCISKPKLEEHLRTHGNEKAFACDICGAKYAHRHNLRIHVNSKHADLKKDETRKYEKRNLTSRQGVKRKRIEEN